jgi:hypothetical protein
MGKILLDEESYLIAEGSVLTDKKIKFCRGLYGKKTAHPLLFLSTYGVSGANI